MSDGPIFISDVLPEHVRFVRAVARSLLDEHEAEDAVQDTLLKALEQPPEPGNIRGWLRVVVRNFALRKKREERRRKHREMLQGPPGHITSPEESLARIEGQQRVLAAVRDLPEPYRTTVVHHYLDELTREQMAALLGVPVETVRTRLKRALKLLRERLDQDDGGTHTWIAALAPLLMARPGPAVGAGASTAALLTAKVVVVAALVGCGALLLASRGGSSAPVRATAEAMSAMPEVATRSATAPVEEDAKALLVRCVVRDIAGTALADARAVAADGSERRTGQDGIFRIAASSVDGRASLVVRKEGYLPWRGVLDAMPDREHSITLVRGAPLTVVVRARDGAPVHGALVHVSGREERGIAGLWWSRRLVPVAEGITGPDGRALLGAAPEGRIDIRIDDARYACCRKEVVVAGSEPVLVECLLSSGGEVSGRVTDGAGQPVAQARVYSSAWPDRAVLTAEDGGYELRLVEEGENRIVAEAPGFGIGFFGSSIGWGRPVPVHVSAGRTVKGVDIALPAAVEVRGRVVDGAGHAVRGVRVEALAGPCLGKPVSARSDESGAFAIGPFAGTDGRCLRLTLSLEGYGIEPISIETLPPGGPLDVGDVLARELGGLRGHVFDVDGQPLHDGRVDVLPNGPSALVGPDGAFLLAKVPAGTAQVRASAWGPARSATATVEVEAGGVAPDVEIRLGAALPIRGRVLSPAGKPRPGVAVAAIAEGTGDVLAARTTTDAAGAFDLADLAQGRYRVGILRTPYEEETAAPNSPLEYTDDALSVRLVLPGLDEEPRAAEPVLLGEPQLAVAGADDVTLVLPGPRTMVEGAVHSAVTGRALASYEVSFIEYWRGIIPRGSETLDVHDDQGQFGYELEEGDWAVEITAPGHASLRTRVFRAGSRATWNLGTIRLGPGGSVRGAIRDANGDAVSYARLYLLGPQMQTNRRPIYTDAEGSYEAGSVTPGTYTIFVVSPRHPFGIIRNVVVAENEASPLDVRLDRPSPVTVRVVDESGEPVAGADVSYTCDELFPLTSRLLRSHEPPGWGGYVTDADGYLHKAFLPAGRVLFIVRAPGFSKAKRFAELCQDKDTIVEIRLERKAR